MSDRKKNPYAVAMGRLGGAKGGRRRFENLTPEQRSAIAQRAANARWGNKPEPYGPTEFATALAARAEEIDREIGALEAERRAVIGALLFYREQTTP